MKAHNCDTTQLPTRPPLNQRTCPHDASKQQVVRHLPSHIKFRREGVDDIKDDGSKPQSQRKDDRHGVDGVVEDGSFARHLEGGCWRRACGLV